MHDDLHEYRPMFEAIEHRVLAGVHVTTGEQIRVIAAIVLSVIGLFLGESGAATGWATFVHSSAARAESMPVLAVLSVYTIVVFCVLCSVAALYFKKFSLVFVASAGCAVTSVLAMMAIWSRQSLPASSNLSGPGPGSVVCFVGAVLLTAMWTRLALKISRYGRLSR